MDIQELDLDPIMAFPVYADLFARYVPGYGWVWLAKGIVFRVDDLEGRSGVWWYRRTGRIA